MPASYMSHFNDPFLRALDALHIGASADDELVACHIDLTNAFWSLILPTLATNSFWVQIDGKTYAFACLPFRWPFSPIICYYVLGFILESVQLESVIFFNILMIFWL